MNKEDTNIEKGEKYIKSRSKEYRTIVLSIVAALIIIIVGAVVLAEVLKTDTLKLIVLDEEGNEIGTYENGGELSFVKNKLGYDFVGWVDLESGIVFETLQDALDAGSTSVQQKWEIKTYTLTLYIRDGQIIGDDSYEYHEAEDEKGAYYTKNYTIESDDILLPSSAYAGSVKVEKAGSAFRFWSRLLSSEDSYTAIKKIQKGTTGSITLYAVWNVDPYIVNFIDKDNNIYNQYVLNYKDLVVEPEETPVKEGYEFDGYYTTSSFSTQFTFNTEMLTKQLNVYIKWIPKEYVIEYYRWDTLLETKTYHTDEEIVEYTCPLDGEDSKKYEFKHWKINNNSNDIFNLDKMPPRNLKLYAELDTKKYTITWEIDGNTYEEIYEYKDTPSCEKSTNKASSNTEVYTFTGWKDENGNEGIQEVTESIKYIAQYSSSTRYYSYIIYGTDKISVLEEKHDIEYEESIDLSSFDTPEKASTVDTVYTFKCWSLESGEGSFSDDNKTFILQSDVVIIPIFGEAVRKYIVKFFEYNGETELVDKEIYSTSIPYGYPVSYDEEIYHEITEITGYTKGTKVYSFERWSVDLDEVIVQEDLNVYAVYASDSDKYIIMYYVDEEKIGEEKVDTDEIPKFLSDSTDPYYSCSKDADEIYLYTFVCWYIDSNRNGQYDDGEDEIVRNTTFDGVVKDQIFNLYAHFSTTLVKYSIIFNTDGGTLIDSIEIENGATINYASFITTREGYTFDCWKLVTEEGDSDAPSTMPIKDITIKALWTINQYTISFDTDGGTEVDSITQDYGTSITPPADPTKEGYTFVSWDVEIPLTMPAEDMTLIAKWEVNQYTIKFYMAEVLVEENLYYSITQDYGKSITPPADPTKTGYTFAGWDQEIPETMPAEDITIKALWTINQYTISFDTDGGTEVDSITQDYGTDIEAPADPTKTGYTFKGWKIVTEEGDIDASVPETMPAEDMTLIAKWEVNQYTIKFYMAETLVEENLYYSITQDYGTDVEAPAKPTKTGYTFAGWDVDIPLTMPAEDMTIKALWTINNYTITFDTDGGSEILPITQDYGTDIEAPADPTKTGYTFAGWDQEIPETMPAENITIEALWTANEYTITFDTDGGCEVSSITVTFGEAYGELHTPTKDHYDFVKWTYNEQTITKDTIVSIPENHELKAVWTLHKYELTLSNNFGLKKSIIFFTIEDPIELDSIEVEKGVYELDGWYENEDFSSNPVTSYEAGVKTSDFTLYGNFYTKGLTFTLVEEEDVYSVTAYDKTLTTSFIYVPKVYQGKQVTTIEEKVFRNSKNITSVNIDNILYVKASAFMGCINLTQVSMNSVETISESAFAYCTSLEYVYMENVKIIETSAFAMDASLKQITISNKLTTVGDEAFIEAATESESFEIIYKGTDEEFNDIIIGTSNDVFVWANVKQD